ncbi:MAG: putative zinc-binding protein [Desulfobacterales bacterium]|nr:MAG: putative zinc-binding protein [Desulfobacterales bacterium]
MVETIQIKLTNQACPAGLHYAQKHATAPPKDAVISCEGVCLKGETARRAANLIAHRLAPDKAVRICHGGLLEVAGGMRDLVERVDRVLVVDGCPMACGTRIAKGAFPDLKPEIVFTDKLFELDSNLFGANEMSETDINNNAQEVATKIIRKYFDNEVNSLGLEEEYAQSHPLIPQSST